MGSFYRYSNAKSNFQNYYKILETMGSKTRINITNDIDIKYYLKMTTIKIINSLIYLMRNDLTFSFFKKKIRFGKG